MTKHGIFKIGLIAFIILFVLFVYFAYERILYFDTPFHLFKIINFEKINIEANRYSTFITQIPLLLAIKLNLPIQLLIHILNISYFLLFLGIYFLIIKFTENIYISLAYILLLIVNIKQCFYFSSTETHQALVYSALTFSLLFSKEKNHVLLPLLILISIALSFFSHPVAFFCVIYSLGYYMIDKNKFQDKKIYFYILFTILLVVFKILYVKSDSYEGNFFNTLFFRDNSWDNPVLFSAVFLWRNLIKLYWVNFVGLIILLIFLRKQQKKLSFYYHFFAFFIFLSITIITYQKGDADVMMERAYMPLSFFTILPLFNELSKSDKIKKYLLYFFVLIFTVSIVRIANFGFYLKNGLNEVDKLIYEAIQKNNHKIIIENRNFVTKDELKRWSMPFMSLLYSKSKYDKCVTINVVNNINDAMPYINNKEKCNILLGPDFWPEWKVEDLNQKYYNFPPCELYTLKKFD